MTSSSTLTVPALQTEVELSRIRELTRVGRYAEALAAGETLAAQVPKHRDALYLIAMNQRLLKRIPEALECLERLQREHPRFSGLYQERGLCYVSLRDAPRAIDAFTRGVTINPALPASWSMLERLHRMLGDTRSAETAAAYAVTLTQLPAEVVHAGGLFSDGDLDAAEHAVRAYVQRGGNHVEALRLLARIAQQRDALHESERLLETVLERAPDYHAARADYARVLIGRQKYLPARGQIDILLKLDPGNKDYRLLQATVCTGLAEHEPAITLYRELLALAPAWSHLYVLVGHSLKALSRQKEAIEAYQAALAARPDFGDAYWSLANLKTYRFSEDEIARMRLAEAAAAARPDDRCPLCFALGKALEDRGEYAASWTYYERGNELKRGQSRYHPKVAEINTRRQIEVCTKQFFAARAGVGVADCAPIFIVGLPRSGSTLIEQILASHTQVEGTQELYDIPRIVLELQGRRPDPGDPRYPGTLAELGRDAFRGLGERYLADTRTHHEGKPFFVDKMPNNFRHIGLIHLMMPNAKIIDVRREPMACCFSNLKQLFASGQGFTYDIGFIARYYRTYIELMRHWDEVLPGRVLRLHYEDVVEDLEGNVRRILEFCGLGFERACLEFHRTERCVSTASSEQVRQPIFREGLDQWRKYEPWLGSLKDTLGDALSRYRD
jgi:tetratricopeptide (TPR) repeat protein